MAAELVTGAVLSSFLHVVFDRLASRDILDYFRKRKINETLLKRLNITLNSISAVVDDAENKEIENERVKVWVVQVKDAVFDAEDLLDEIDIELSKRKQLEAESGSSTASKVWNFFSASVVSFDKEIEARMKQILDHLEYLASQKDILGLQEGGRKFVSHRTPSTCLVNETVICGRDDDKEMIIDWLLSEKETDNHIFSVISIVGMGGMGKTTLAQLVYNDQRLQDKFDLKAWVCVSEEFNIVRVTSTILEAFNSAYNDAKELNTLQVKLKEKLSGKRFLLVLDDVWHENHMQWEDLQTPFIYGAQGSKVIVTTRSNKVASAVRSAKIHQLVQLGEEKSWLLFAKYAFLDRDPQSNPELEEIGWKIVMKCKGLPLALKAIGSLLYTKSSCEEWNSILTSEIWDMSDDGSGILPALRLSYRHLPSLLKRCFAYCCIFPKDYVFEKEDVVQLWMAENLLQFPQQSKSMKEVGDQFFQDLLARSFFQHYVESERRFVMHDLINDLAKYISGEFFFIQGKDKTQPKTAPKMIRHFSYLGSWHENFELLDVLHKANRLRTFLHLSMYGCSSRIHEDVIHELLTKLKCVRVLSLSNYENLIKLPDSLGNLKLLRYLDLSHTKLKKLPDSTCLLYNLRTLKLRGCWSLVELPSDLHRLVNLRHLDIQCTRLRKMPKHMGKLKQLEILSFFCVGTCNETNITQLGELNLWGELSILDLQNVSNPMDASEANLKNKVHLEKIELEWSIDTDDTKKVRDVLAKLQPHNNLKDLSIKNYGGTRFPDWFGDNLLQNLVSLKLINCKYCVLLPPLGLLPSLKKLSIMGFDAIVSVGLEFYYSNNSSTIPFGSLECLKFKNMLGWEKWECKDLSSAFPRLHTLHLINCPMLIEELPEEIPCLNSLVIEKCQQLVGSIPQATAIQRLTLLECERLQLSGSTSSLEFLRVGGSHMEVSLLENIQHAIVNSCLERLYIVHCLNMDFSMHHGHNFLKEINIKNSCESLRSFPLNLFPKLEKLCLMGCSNLEMICVSEGHECHYVTSLTSLSIFMCPKFVSISEEGWSAPRLKFFGLCDLENLKSLPECMRNLFPSPFNLMLKGCPQLESFPDEGLPLNISLMRITNCSKLFASRMEWNLQMCSSLDYLTIGDANVECFPDEGLLPPSLTYLRIKECSNLKMLNFKGLCHLSSLNWLKLHSCPRLECLPQEGLPTSISYLSIKECSLLKQRCQKQNGEDWGKIDHIDRICIDGEIII